jgi:hypothetical protein
MCMSLMTDEVQQARATAPQPGLTSSHGHLFLLAAAIDQAAPVDTMIKEPRCMESSNNLRI